VANGTDARDLSGRTPASGRFVLRIDPGLHAALRAAARESGVSLNDYCARKLALPVGSLAATDPAGAAVARAAGLFGERLLEGLLGRPDAARRALRIITDAILACIRAFSEAIPEDIRRTSVAACRYAPAGFGLIDGCAAQLVSARLYQEFFAPMDEELLGAHPRGGMIHLCGACAQHIPTWANMPSLRSVQLNDRATEDFELFFHGLRSDQIMYVGPTQSMTTERILGISKGERIILQSYLTEDAALS